MVAPEVQGAKKSSESSRPTQYFAGQVRPRLRAIVFHRTTYLACFASVVLYVCARWTTFGDVPIEAIRTNLTAYAALSFGASISGCILILTLPSREFIRIASSHRIGGRRQSSYSDLLFVFTFSAVAQLWTIGVVVAMFALGGSEAVLADGARATHHLLFLLAAFVVVFSLVRLVVVVTTVSQLGVVIESAVREEGDGVGGGDSDVSESSSTSPDQPARHSDHIDDEHSVEPGGAAD